MYNSKLDLRYAGKCLSCVLSVSLFLASKSYARLHFKNWPLTNQLDILRFAKGIDIAVWSRRNKPFCFFNHDVKSSFRFLRPFRRRSVTSNVLEGNDHVTAVHWHYRWVFSYLGLLMKRTNEAMKHMKTSEMIR